MRRSTMLAALLSALLVLSAAGPAAAHPVAHGDGPVLINPSPAPGDVVPTGAVTVSALAVANQPVDRVELRVDGVDVPASSSGGDHAVVSGAIDLSPGLHTAELVVGNAHGEARRSWRFRTDGAHVRRLSGSGRIETAVAISADLYPEAGSAAAAVLARADAFPDALAGGPLAHAADGPLLLTAGDRLSGPAADELRRVLPAGATVYLLGGPAALSQDLEQDVAALGFQPARASGTTRFDTAAAIGRLMPAAATAVVASGETFADALAVSAPAARDGVPILLTSAGSLPEATRQALVDRGVTDVQIVGGPAAVSVAVEEQLSELVGAQRVERISGRTRFDTAAAIARRHFDLTLVDTVAVANGLRFPDALAGGRHAAATGAPLLLVDTHRMFDPQAVLVAETQPSAADLYGGAAAVGEVAAAEVRRARASAGGPLITSMSPSGAQITTLDEVVVQLDRDVHMDHSSIHVTIDGTEAQGSLRHGEFADSLVFTISALPDFVVPRTPYTVDVFVTAGDGTAVRATQRRMTLLQPPASLARGDRGPEVVELQTRLRDAGYWVGSVDGAYGALTHQAVMALQKAHGLARDGVYGLATRELLERGPARPTPRSGPGSGLVYEVDLQRQILMRVVNGHVEWIFNTSTGHGRTYEFNGRTYTANTTTGRHRIVRQIDGLREAERGQLWRPKYYDNTRGIAIHGATSVPAEPASSGCVRVTYAAMDFIWSLDPGTGAGVWVYPEA